MYFQQHTIHVYHINYTKENLQKHSRWGKKNTNHAPLYQNFSSILYMNTDLNSISKLRNFPISEIIKFLSIDNNHQLKQSISGVQNYPGEKTTELQSPELLFFRLSSIFTSSCRFLVCIILMIDHNSKIHCRKSRSRAKTQTLSGDVGSPSLSL